MKDFKYPMLRKEFTNRYGEIIIMVLDRNASIWIHHNDCNTDFEKLSNFTYILSEEENVFIQSFCNESEKIIEDLQKI